MLLVEQQWNWGGVGSSWKTSFLGYGGRGVVGFIFFLLVNSMFGSVILSLLNLMALLGIYIYLYLGLP